MKRLFLLLFAGLATAGAAQAPPEMHFVPLFPDVSSPVTVLVEGTGCPLVFVRTDIADRHFIVRAVTPQTFAPCEPGPWAFETGLGRLAARRYVVELVVDDKPVVKHALVVRPASAGTLYLYPGPVAGETAFEVGLRWSYPGETEQQIAYAIETSPMAGYFWFFSPDSPEAMVKIVDGSPINGHAWLVLSSLTTLPFTLRVTHCDLLDPPQCKFRDYRYPGGLGPVIVDYELE
jgi:hypothetical protein